MDRRALGPLTAGCASSLAVADDIVVVYLVCRGLRLSEEGQGSAFELLARGCGAKKPLPIGLGAGRRPMM